MMTPGGQHARRLPRNLRRRSIISKRVISIRTRSAWFAFSAA
jgi:hypothetical protein